MKQIIQNTKDQTKVYSGLVRYNDVRRKMTKGKTHYTSSPHPANRRGGIISRFIMYIIIGLLMPFVLKRIRNQLIREQRFRCERCNKKMQMINRNEYYCKECKIIRLDDR